MLTEVALEQHESDTKVITLGSSLVESLVRICA